MFHFDLTVSIVVYQASESLLQKCLSSLLGSPLRIKTVVVDNSPTDRLRGVVTKAGAEYRQFGSNLGFGVAHNMAITECIECANYHLVLNPDVYFGGAVLEELTSYLDANPQVGLIMPQVLYPDGTRQYLCKLLPNPADLLLRRLSYGRFEKLLQSRNDRYEFRNVDPMQTRSIPVLSGCFMLLRTEVFCKVGMFDERYFMYMEDVDFCRRIHRCFDVVYYPHVSVVHEYAKGSYKEWKLTKFHIQSAWRYFSKWGWLFDSERTLINELALQQQRVHDSEGESQALEPVEPAVRH